MMKKQTEYNVTFGGIGGQGIIKASELVGWAAMYEGFPCQEVRGARYESARRFG